MSQHKPVSVAEAKALFGDLADRPALVLAVSGGPDSTALMLLAARWRDGLTSPPKLIAVTVDHGLRKEAKREATEVAKLARKLKITHRTLRWTGKKPKTGLQQAARAARYRLLGEAARNAGATHILTAHTLDDQAETVLIRMSRGSGMTGLAAMQRVTPLARSLSSPSPLEGEGWGGGYVSASGIKKLSPSRRVLRVDLPLKGGGEEQNVQPKIFVSRPLLEIPKARLIATLDGAGVAYAEDPSNRDPRFTRARLRGLMPVLAGEGLDARRLSILAARMKRADAAIEAEVDSAWRKLAAYTRQGGSISFKLQDYSGLAEEIRLRLLGRAVAAAGDEGPVELGKLESLKAALDAAQSSGTRHRRTLAGAVVTLTTGEITVEQAPPRRGRPLTKPVQAKAKGARAR